MASGHGTVDKGQPGRVRVIDALSTDLSDPQKLLVDDQVKAPQFQLVKLPAASCTGVAGERVFQGSGTAIRNSKRGYTVSFSIKERAGGFFFEASS
jgi:hypothetical protein